MIGIFLCACLERHPNYNIIYNDYDKKYNCDIIGDCMKIDISNYDYIIASPPCNYYSRANYRREQSEYALNTKHLLPDLLEKLGKQEKPFIIENVRNPNLMKEKGIFKICDKYNINVYFIGRHTYFTNIFINLYCPQQNDFHSHKIMKKNNIKFQRQNYRQGGDNVYNVIEIWLSHIHTYYQETLF